MTTARIGRLRTAARAGGAGLRDRAALHGTTVAPTSLPDVLDRIDRSLLVARSTLLIVTLQLILLAGYALLLVARLLSTERTEETRLLRARGASRARLAVLAAAEALLLALPRGRVRAAARRSPHPSCSPGTARWRASVCTWTCPLDPTLPHTDPPRRTPLDTSEPQVVAAVREARPDILFLAVPSPRKEYFLARRQQELGCALVVGVGGSFDVVAGLRSRAPRWMRRAGLEWFHRLVQEPRRMFVRYAVGNCRFLALTAVYWMRRSAHREGGA
jgi:hypothetical protein